MDSFLPWIGLFLAFCILIGAIAFVAALFRGVHEMSNRLKATISLLVALYSIWFAYSAFDEIKHKDLRDQINTETKRVVDSMRVMEKRLIDSQNEIIELLHEQRLILTDARDSLLVRIDSLDTCIDKHFHTVNATLNTRFSYIDSRLQDIKQDAPR